MKGRRARLTTPRAASPSAEGLRWGQARRPLMFWLLDKSDLSFRWLDAAGSWGGAAYAAHQVRQRRNDASEDDDRSCDAIFGSIPAGCMTFACRHVRCASECVRSCSDCRSMRPIRVNPTDAARAETTLRDVDGCGTSETDGRSGTNSVLDRIADVQET